jgi:hypothetical protein
LRNQSIFVDLFYGQFKSDLFCTDCKHTSTTFESFQTVSLPIPINTDIFEIVCFFLFYDISITPIQLVVPFLRKTSVMAFRNKLAKLMLIHPMSFIIVQLEKGQVDRYLSTSHTLELGRDNNKPLFLFQINPDLFMKTIVSKYDSTLMTKNFGKIYDTLRAKVNIHKEYFAEEYQDDETGITSPIDGFYKNVNVDNNHGFGSEFIKVIINLEAYDTCDTRSTERIIFPRVIYMNTTSTCAEIHLQIFEYFSKLFNKKGESNEKNWKRLFKDLDTEIKNDTFDFQNTEGYPYRVRIRNICRGTKQACFICNNITCFGCLLPYSTSLRLKDLLAKYPVNHQKQLDNTFYYLSDSQRKENKYTEFKLVLTWLQDYKEKVLELNTKKDHFFSLPSVKDDKHISLYDCFKNFGQFEKLDSSNEWFCTSCKKHQKAGKKIEIYKTPAVLIIHLKRFKNHKITNLVDFPVNNLILDGLVGSETELVYDLVGVANHSGALDYGHYYAYVKNPIAKRWYKFDDSHVTQIGVNEIVTNTAYILIYRRRGLENMLDLLEIYNQPFVDYEKDIERLDGKIFK